LSTNGSGTLSWATAGGGSAATPTALGTVYGKQTSGGGTPFLTAYGYNAGVSTTGVSNTAVGTSALQSNTSGIYSTAVGYQAGYSHVSVGYNTFVGYQAGYADTGGQQTAVGYKALFAATSSRSTAVGQEAALSTTTGSVVAVGVNALRNNTTGEYNTAVGGTARGLNSSLQANTTGSHNTAVGDGALAANTTSNFLTAVGSQALYSSNHTANGNGYSTAVGYQAGKATVGATVTAIGANVLYLSTGDSNVGVGGETDGANSALKNNTTGSTNTAMGVYSLQGSQTGVSNTAYGYGSCNNLTTGGYNTFVGAQTYASSTGVSDEVVIGYGITGKGGNTGFLAPTNGVYQGNNSSSWSTTSDQRLKKNIADNNDGLDKITSIRVRNFEYRTKEEVTELPKKQVIDKQGVQLGVIAQELQAVLPECVRTQTTGVLTVDTDNLTWYMINAIKQLKAEIDQLKGNV
jgi:hypothetical protein